MNTTKDGSKGPVNSTSSKAARALSPTVGAPEVAVNKCVRLIETSLQKLGLKGHRQIPLAYLTGMLQVEGSFSSAVLTQAYDVATSPTDGFALITGARESTTAQVSFRDAELRFGKAPDPTPTIKAPPTVTKAALVPSQAAKITPAGLRGGALTPAAIELRNILIQLAADGDDTPRMSTVGAMLKKLGFDNTERHDAFALATDEATGFADKVGTLGNASFVLRRGVAPARAVVAPLTPPPPYQALANVHQQPPGMQPTNPWATDESASTPSRATAYLRTLLVRSAAAGDAAPRMSLMGTQMAQAGYDAKERADAFAEALGPHGFAIKFGTAGNTTLSLVTSRPTAPSQPPASTTPSAATPLLNFKLNTSADSTMTPGDALARLREEEDVVAAALREPLIAPWFTSLRESAPIAVPAAVVNPVARSAEQTSQVLRQILARLWHEGDKTPTLSRVGALLDEVGIVGGARLACLSHAAGPKGFATVGGAREQAVIELRDPPSPPVADQAATLTGRDVSSPSSDPPPSPPPPLVCPSPVCVLVERTLR